MRYTGADAKRGKEPIMTTAAQERIQKYLPKAQQGDPEAQREVGAAFIDDKQYRMGVAWLERAAEQEDVTAQVMLAAIYSTGFVGENFVPQDIQRSTQWYVRAAGQGSITAMLKLGERYDWAANYGEAAYWYGQAAKRGDAEGMQSLGNCYRGGLGVPKDAEKAMYWLQQASDLGNADAQFLIGYMYENGDGVEKDELVAKAWYYKAALNGQPKACRIMGMQLKSSDPDPEARAYPDWDA